MRENRGDMECGLRLCLRGRTLPERGRGVNVPAAELRQNILLLLCLILAKKASADRIFSAIYAENVVLHKSGRNLW